MEKPTRCAIYIRVSTEEQHLNGLSLPAQRKALTEYAKQRGYLIVDCYADEGISARKPMRYRKALLRLLGDVREDKIDMILVTKLDRWFRNIKDYHATEEILNAHHCHWKTIFEQYDSSTANGQMVINIMLSVNQAECDRTSERIKAVLNYKRSIGEVTSGRCACYGYRVENNRLVKDETVAHIVEDAYSHYFTCYSIRSTIKYLNETYGGDAPSASKVDRLFKNETYAGRDRDNMSYCEPYLTAAQYERIKQVAVSKANVPKKYDPYVFSSLIKCPVCGHNFTGYRKRQTLKNGKANLYVKYRCGNKFGRHGGASLSEHKVEEYLLSQTSAKLGRDVITIEFSNRSSRKAGNPDAVKKEIDRLNLLFQKGRITEAYYDEQYELLEQTLKEMDRTQITAEHDRDVITAFRGDWAKLYGSLDKAHRQVFWKSTIRDILIDPDTRKIAGFSFVL